MAINEASNILDDIFDNEDIRLSQGSSKSVLYETQENDTEAKIFNDSIHGHIELHPLLIKFIDTPQFQRLRNIKQLGGNYFVFPGASHNRFEHSIGTCYLAGKLVKQLQQKQLCLDITNVDVLCVQIAGLCHDLGHGPFSHMFDHKFIPQLRPDIKWNHERGSCILLDYLIQDNNLQPELKKHEITDQDIEFIKEMIAGPIYSTNANDVWRYKGRDQSKSFLYEIVSNERNKVDVDKWDYFARDCHHLGMKNGFDHNRFMHSIRVLTVEGQSPQICARDKEAMNVYELFHVRNRLHRSAYQHKCKTAVEEMICDAMVLANDFIKYRGKDGKEFSIAECIDDPVAFVKLTDHVFDQILHSNDMNPDMVKARHILERIQKREIYKFVDEVRPGKKPMSQSCLKIQSEIASDSLNKEDISVNILKYDYGMNTKNPCDNFMFYSKNQPTKPYYIRKEEVSVMLPNSFQDCVIQMFCKDQDKLELAKDCFDKWCANNDYKMKSVSHNAVLTPLKRKSIGQGRSAKIPKLSKF